MILTRHDIAYWISRQDIVEQSPLGTVSVTCGGSCFATTRMRQQ